MNRLAWLVAVAVLALGSVAVAQPGLIIDPWGASRVRTEQAGRFRVAQRLHGFPGSSELIVDPWGVAASSSARKARSSEGSVAARSNQRRTAWISTSEIVDPWAPTQRASSVRFDALIVDPWQR